MAMAYCTSATTAGAQPFRGVTLPTSRRCATVALPRGKTAGRTQRLVCTRAAASENAGEEEELKVSEDGITEPVDASENALDTNISKKAKLAIKSSNKQILSLRFLWMDKNIGIALDQVIPGHGTIPLSPFYFWPKKDAWEELKAKLESKPWISRRRTIILLNQATDIINLWQQKASSSF